MAYLGAKMQSGIETVLSLLRFDEAIRGADLVLTGEGKSDRQTLMGKAPLRRLASQFGGRCACGSALGCRG